MAQGQQERDTAEIQLHSNLTTPYWVPTACLYCLSPVQNGLSKEPLNFLSFLFLLILVWCPFRTCVWWWPKANRTEILYKFSFTQIWSFKRQAWLVSSSLFTHVILKNMNYPFERHHGVMVRRLYFGLRDAGLRPGQVNVLCSLAKHFTVTVPLSTREYKWIVANCQRGAMKCWGVNLQWSGIPSRRES